MKATAAPLLAVLALGAPVSSASESDPPRQVIVAQAQDQPADEPAGATSERSPAKPAKPASDEATPGVEVLRVVGRGTGAIETDVPSSLTQFDASTIQALGAQDISDLSRVTPNVNIVQPGSTQATFFVRGIGLSDFSSNAAGAVTIFQDDVSINAPAIQTGQLFDVEGVDIVRGPQGSGPFRNASAGAIRVRSRRPTGNYEAQLHSSDGYYDTRGDKGAREALIQDYDGALGFPIVEGWLSSRFAFRLRDAEPYKTNGCGNALPFAQRLPNTPRTRANLYQDPRVQMCGERDGVNWPPRMISQIPVGLPRWVNDEHQWAARGTLRFSPPDSDVEFFLNGHGSRLDQDSTLGQAIGHGPCLPSTPGIGCPLYGTQAQGGGYIDPDIRDEFEVRCGRSDPTNPFSVCNNLAAAYELSKRLARTRPLDRKPFRGDYDRVGQTTRDAWGSFVSGEAPVLGDLKLFGLASVDGYVRRQDTDTDFTPEPRFEIRQDDRAWQTYQELKLSGELEREPVEWNIGGYYLHEELGVDQTITLLDANNTVIRRPYQQKLDSFAGWGELSWDFADDLTLEGGVRYNYEAKRFHFRRINLQQGLPFSSDFDRASRQDQAWQTPTGQLILTYHLSPDASAYAKYARGFKAGHFNAQATQNLDEPPAKEEYNDSWETGLRGAWLDHRLSLATAFFYYRYENYQVFLFTDSPQVSEPPVLTILNAKQAENYGVEVEGTFTPLRGWVPELLQDLRLSANFSWLHGEYLDFSTVQTFALGGQSAPVVVDFSGKSLQNSPEYKVSATAEWTLDFGRWGYLIPRYDINWSADVFFDTNEGHGGVNVEGGPNLPDYAVGQAAYFLHNVRLAYRTPSANVEVAVWCRNVEDQVFKNYAFDASRVSGLVIYFPGEPRSIGVDVSFTF